MNTPSRRALEDVRNQVLGTPTPSLHKPTEVFKTPASSKNLGLVHHSTASKIQPKFLDFDGGDDFEVYSEEPPKVLSTKKEVVETKLENVTSLHNDNKALEEEYEPVETFDYRPESPDRFEDIVDQFRELEKIVLVDEFASDDSYQHDFKLCDNFPSDFDDDLDLENINIIEEPDY